MSAASVAAPRQIRVTASPRLRRLYVAFVVMLLIAIALLPLTISIKMVLGITVSWLLVKTWYQRAELGGSPLEFRYTEDGQWFLRKDGEEFPVTLSGDSTVSGPLMLLCFISDSNKGRYEIVLWHKEQNPDNYRCLRVYLELYAKNAANPVQSDN